MQNNQPRNGHAPWSSVGVILVGLATLGSGRADARALAGNGGLPEGTRFTAPDAVAGDPYQRGKTLLASGDAPGAVAAFRAALADEPQSIDALNGLGVAFDRLGRYDIARGYYDLALAVAPDSPLVLNNLGYSLYLQGEDAAAIPFLRRALAAMVPGGPAPAQRILSLIADRMRTQAAANETAIARAEIAAPAARVELSANGEQRLVLAAAAPAPELVARLGDAAVLTSPAQAWTASDDAAVAASAVELPLSHPVVPAAGSAPVAGLLVVAAAALPTLSSPAPVISPRRLDRALHAVAQVDMLAAPVLRRLGLQQLGLRRQRPEPGPAQLALLSDGVPTGLPPALSMSSTLTTNPAITPPAAVALFDSDDAALNAFAARMAAWRPAGLA